MNFPANDPRFISESRFLAVQMHEIALHILKEISGTEMPDGLRNQIEELCLDLVGTKKGILGELTDLQNVPQSVDRSAQIELYPESVRQITCNTLALFDACVQSVQEAVNHEIVHTSLLRLVFGSAAFIRSATPSSIRFSVAPQMELDLPRQDAEGFDEGPRQCFEFKSEDHFSVSQLILAIRLLLNRPDISPREISEIGAFLFAMERLPLITRGFDMGIALQLRDGVDSKWISVSIDDSKFALSRGGGIDRASSHKADFEAGLGYRKGSSFDASDFAKFYLSTAKDASRGLMIYNPLETIFDVWQLEGGTVEWSELSSDLG